MYNMLIKSISDQRYKLSPHFLFISLRANPRKTLATLSLSIYHDLPGILQQSVNLGRRLTCKLNNLQRSINFVRPAVRSNR